MSEAAHATAVLVGARGILIRGPSGAGKSTLAWALIRRGGRLVADDRVHLSACHGRVLATAPAAIAGRLELYGRGVVRVPHERSAVLRLVVDFVDEDGLERMPDDTQLSAVILGVALPRQPVPRAPDHALTLVLAALEALAREADIGLRSA